MKNIELLAPAGDFEKLKTALYFGADAVYAGGRNLSLRAFTGFSDEEMERAVRYTHERGKKLYAAVNILARNTDLGAAGEYFEFLQAVGADAAIVSDVGLLSLAKRRAPRLALHVSTQANALNAESVKVYAGLGASRVILARELSVKEIAEIAAAAPRTELEIFVHGAMCVSYSGRCLMSNYLAGRDSNRGECAQPCSWRYEVREAGTDGAFYPVEEDGRGTYLFNSKDLNMIDYLPELAESGACSFKIEGRMKSAYYIATVVNAYRRALDAYAKEGAAYRGNRLFSEELNKAAHREYTTAYLLGENAETESRSLSQVAGERSFAAVVLSYDEKTGRALVEMRNRFCRGDTLEVLSPAEEHNALIRAEGMTDENGLPVEDAKLVQQKLYLPSPVKLRAGDILRK